MSSETVLAHDAWGEVPPPPDPPPSLEDAAEAYAEIEIVEPTWGEDSDLVELWFEQGEALDSGALDWIQWIDLYTDRVDRSDLIVHWLRCLFEPGLPRPPALMTG